MSADLRNRQGFHRQNMATLSLNRSALSKRRSPRIGLNTTIRLSGEDRAKCSFTMSAKATNLNKHGAAIQLSRELGLGTTVVVQNKCGAQITARVVTQVSAVRGVHTYGIEFVEQNERSRSFWGITFPSLT